MTSLIDKTFHGYHLLRQLGTGGMGEVYLAQESRLARLVALKVLRQAHGEPERARRVQHFLQEMRLVAALDHPRIVPLYTFGEADLEGSSLLYMVMPYRAGGSLADWLASFPQGYAFSPRLVGRLIAQVGSALSSAHRQGIAHLDVKPANLLLRHLASRSQVPDLVLADFGIARLGHVTPDTVWPIRFMGTPLVMAPEQWGGKPEPASDQYALAVLTYRLLTGRAPFVGTPEQLCEHHLSVTPLAPSQVSPSLSKLLDTVLLRALAKHPEQRFPSVSSFARALQRAASPSRDAGSCTISVPASLRDTQTGRDQRKPEGRGNGQALQAATTVTCLSPSWNACAASSFPATQPAHPVPRERAQGSLVTQGGETRPDGVSPLPARGSSRRRETSGWFSAAGCLLFFAGGWLVWRHLDAGEPLRLYLITLLSLVSIGAGIWLDCRDAQRRLKSEMTGKLSVRYRNRESRPLNDLKQYRENGEKVVL